MWNKLGRALKNMHRGQEGMTGLETAIILIAFVTVASVLAYSVLSAGLFSAERGKTTVYQGLEQAQATMEIMGSVLGLSPNETALEQVQFTVGLTIPDQQVDMTAVVINYYDDEVTAELTRASSGLGTWTSAKSAGSSERGAGDMLETDELHKITVTMPSTTTRDAYDQFTIQVIPPTGATVTVQRTLPGTINKVMDLQ